MKKLFLIVAVAIFSLGTVNAFAQETTTPATEETAVVEEVEETAATETAETPASETQLAEGQPMHQVLMQKFLEGGWEWMLPVLLCLVFGLAVAIERMLYLSLSTINSKKLIAQVEEALKKGGIEAAKEVCRNKRGPVASIFYQVWTVTTRVWTALKKPSFPTVRFRRPHGVGFELDRSVHRT